MVAAPHTSNWDFIMMMAMAWVTGVTPVWLGKREMFRGPAGWLFRKLGGVAVDRENPVGLVDHMVERATDGSPIAILIPPEGTRSKKTLWKSGFRRIAQGADVPVQLSFLDQPTRTGGYGPLRHMTDDVVADMDWIRAFYADKHGMKPGRFTTPLLREEEEAAVSGPT